ncbi:ATP-binding protein [Methylomonas montana]|uniref:sensor histidine kinase n=1 Tax=Methylomonas montana TaxID=3058963 RepID=UPI002658F4BB|nr:ATP-binding protein [Methylomonas montana]WKJ88618.1 ATP-binding protein [Methylomonas montana]
MKRSAVINPEAIRPAKSWRVSLHTRILLASILVFGLMTGAVVFNSGRVIKSAMLENIRVSEQQTSEILNLAAAPYAVSGDYTTLKAFLDELLRQESVQSGLIYLAVGREDGSILMQSGGVDGPLPSPDQPDMYPVAIERGVVHIRRPLLLGNNSVGFLQYGLSFKLMLEANERLNRQAALLAIAGLAIVSGVLLLIMLKIVQRINVLAKASLAIAHGDYSHRAPDQAHDEIGLLATNFNQMADAIQQRVHEITLLNQELESRVAARTQDLVTLNSTLKQTIDDLKWTQENLIRSEKLAGLGALVAGVAHELNTPIGNALTVATTLQDHTRTITQEFQTGLRRASLDDFLAETRTAGELIARNLHRAADLITSFKHVAVDQTSENRRDFELRTTLEEIVATLLPTLKKTPYRLILDIPSGIVLNSYPGALGQIVTNLVNNALLHAFESRDCGLMTLSAALLDNRHVQLTFSDDGIGMPPETLKRIFDPFFTTRLGQGGSGLGMSIVHNLIYSLLDGVIEVESSQDQGTRFTIQLPLNIPSA